MFIIQMEQFVANVLLVLQKIRVIKKFDIFKMNVTKNAI